MYPIIYVSQRLLSSPQIKLKPTLPLLCFDKQCCLTRSTLGIFKVILQHAGRICSFADQEFFLMLLIKSLQKQLYTFRFPLVNIRSADVPMCLEPPGHSTFHQLSRLSSHEYHLFSFSILIHSKRVFSS